MKKKLMIIISSFILTVIAFTGLYFIQQKMLHPGGQEKIYVLKKTIDKNTIIDDKNFDDFFKLEERDKNTIINEVIKDKSDIINTYAKVTLYKNEAIVKDRLGDNKKRIEQIENKRTMSLKFSDIGEVVGGTLKKGDLIDIIVTETGSGTTKTKLQGIYIEEVFSADGNVINRNNGNKAPAILLNLCLSAENGHILENALNNGRVKVMKVEDDSSYSGITITK